MRLKDRTILITGGAAGIGRATALRCAREGARVALLDTNEEAGRETGRAVREAGADALFLRCDVRREEEVAAAVAAVRDRWGGARVLINGAGILQGAYRPVDELDLETFSRVLDVNLAGTFLCCKHAVPLLEASGGGVILCIASGGGVQGPSSSLAYGASKAGIQGFCLTLERQLRPRGIRVNVVCPGALDTEMKRRNLAEGAAARGEDPAAAVAAAELGDPDGVAKVLVFLASEEADYVRGTVFTR